VKKFIPEGKQITSKYSIKLENKPEEVSLSELRGLIKPKANGRLLFWMPKLYYNFRQAQKPTKLNSWLNKNYGEEAVYTELMKLEKVNKNMEVYLGNVGFFNSSVTYQIKKVRFKDRITFNVKLSTPYTISKIDYDISDTLIKSYVLKNNKKSLIKEGQIYNAYTLDDERDRISGVLRNSGYYLFSRNYIQFMVDSNHRDHSMNLTLKLNNIKELTDIPGEFTEQNHDRYFITQVSVIPDLHPSEIQKFDTTKVEINFWDTGKNYSYNFLYANNKKNLKPSAFNQAIKIKPGEAYSVKDVQNTYRRLFNYQIIRTANISFDTVKNESLDNNHKFLNCKISMQQSNLNVFSIEGEGTNSSGDLGMRGNIVFLNKNIFKRAEVLRIRLNGGFEAQTFTETEEGNSSGIFNTFEAGIEGSVFFPRFFSPIKLRSFNQRFNPTTNLRFGYNYQQRPYYSRNITLINLGYSWNQNLKIKHILTPATINFVKINPTPEFEKKLEEETNKRLKEQYSDHMILGFNYSFIFNGQKNTELKNFEYFRINIETSGNLLYGINSLFGTKKNSDGFYEFVGVRYSQYVRVDFDFRQYFRLREKKTTIATRIFIGSGIPYLNSEEIPYERGFYAGGANGMRGWVFRALGPGSYNGTDQYERLGDIQLEYNFEYRFPIYKFFHGGLFIDVGNIWTYNESETFPGGKFDFNDFYKELAADFGFGFRFDFQYFVFRIDLATPFVDPSFPENERWRLGYLQFKKVIGNFGIGYPF
jgi:outer membrane protein assembly factor BamA